ncbi:hypothetical protein PHYPO_G00069280 [Pangasianodon hypophthalmus]|uniref:Uncharacterized protein n=1 Tax=Pangasianodon hypophthalmus TaxID=310915 RepID=A0A5N5LU78_PANHP|nr:hypothetical protein PHYPO_G00069280 [Pangasianodon hypophthalmus]
MTLPQHSSSLNVRTSLKLTASEQSEDWMSVYVMDNTPAWPIQIISFLLVWAGLQRPNLPDVTTPNSHTPYKSALLTEDSNGVCSALRVCQRAVLDAASHTTSLLIRFCALRYKKPAGLVEAGLETRLLPDFL